MMLLQWEPAVYLHIIGYVVDYFKGDKVWHFMKCNESLSSPQNVCQVSAQKPVDCHA